MADARKGISMYRQENINIPVLGLIENMSYFNPPDDKEKKYYIFGKDGVKNLSEDFEKYDLVVANFKIFNNP